MLHSNRAQVNSDAKEISFWESRIGSTDENWDQLAATSPARHADQVKCPVLLLHGDGDTNVPIEQSEIEEAALKSAGKNVQFVRLEGDDHYSKLGATRVRTLKEIESFLASNIGN
jgi:dipeptidyl aminopeptidase/acylaminoacyl peptidase